MHQIPPDAAVILTDTDVIRVARLAVAGLPTIGRLEGGVTDADRAFVASLHRAAQQARNRLKARSAPGCATTLADEDTASGSSAPSWPTVSEAARHYGVSSTYLRRLAATGALKARHDESTGGYRLEPDALVEWDAGRGNRNSHTRAA